MSSVENVAVVSDLHVGCQLGLCGHHARLDDGGEYKANIVQRQAWRWWVAYWAWVHETCKGERISVVVNGDIIDGRHHGSTHQWTHNLATQEDHAVNVLALASDMASTHGGNLYIVRGTEAHAGPCAETEESIAKRLGAKPNKAGQRARYELWLRVGTQRAPVHFLHHVGTTSSAAYEATAVHKEMVESFNEAARWGQAAPAGIVRSHRHRCLHVKIPSAVGNTFAVTTPGWQGKTPFAYRIAGARQSAPQFGGILIRDGGKDEGLYVRTKVWSLDRETPE